MSNGVDNGILGNSIDINLNAFENAAEIKANIKVEETCSKRIWGQVVGCDGQPVANVLVKLLKIVCNNGQMEYVGVAHTTSDCQGFYQFDICQNSFGDCYKIIVNKVITGEEAVINTGGGNCDACEQPSQCPCGLTKPFVTPITPAVPVPSCCAQKPAPGCCEQKPPERPCCTKPPVVTIPCGANNYVAYTK